jgi:hypothetical protein
MGAQDRFRREKEQSVICWRVVRVTAGLRPVLPFLLIAFGLLALAPASARAAESGGIVRLHVLLPDQGDLSAVVVVTMASPAVPGRSWTARVEPGGVATFRNLPSATYRVTVAPEGGSSVSMDVTIEAAELADLETRVSSRASKLELVALGRVGHGLTFAGRPLQDLPESSNLWGLLDTAEPFVIVDRMDNGGLMTADSGLIGSRGASWTTMTMSFGDVVVTGPNRLGRVGVVPNLNAVEAVAVTTGLAPIDLGAPGAAIALVPRRPGPQPQGEVDAAVTDGQMAGRNASAGVPSIDRLASWSDVSAQFGGPITAHAGVFVVADETRSQQQVRAEDFLLPGNVTSLFANAVANLTPHDEVRASTSVQGVSTAYDGRDQFANRDVTESDSFALAQAAWEHVGDAGLRLVSLGFNQSALKPDVTAATAGGTLDRVFDGVMSDPPSDATSRQTTATFEFDPRDIRQGGVDHAARFGVTLLHSSETSTFLTLPTVAETVDGLPARVWVTGAPAAPVSERHVTDLTAYASDLMQLASRLTVQVGVRADLTTGSAQGAPTGVSWKTLAPRVSLTWAPNLATLFAGYSRYYSPLSLDWLAFGDPGSPTSKVFRWTDANGDGRFEPGEQGPLVAVTGWGQSTGSIDPALRAPEADEVTVGAERWFGTTLRLHAAATIRNERDLAGAVNVGVPASSYTTSFILDQGPDYFGTGTEDMLAIYNRLPSSFGQDRYMLTNPAGDTSRYEGLELTGEVRGTHISSIVGAMAYLTRGGAASPGFTALENDQGVIGDRFIDPNAVPYEAGSNFFDRSYVLKWSTTYEGAHGIHAGVSARYQDGQPFTRLVVAPDLNQGPEVIQAYRVGRTRFLYTVTIDAEIAKAFRFGHSREVEFRVDAFNLTNQANEVEENPVTGPSFRQTTAVQPPRTVRLGIKVRF